MNISGVLVHANPEKLAAVRDALVALDGVEVHGVNDDGRFVTTIEDTTDTLAADTLLSVHRLDGVLSATLVYHSFEADEDVSANFSHEQKI